MEKKILIIGQAPPAKAQEIPYDSTMLYEWLAKAGVSKQQAQDLFIFEAMTDEFTGTNNTNRGHKMPKVDAMKIHFAKSLKHKIAEADKIILLGGVPDKFFSKKHPMIFDGKKLIRLIHPSRRNVAAYKKDWVNITKQLIEIIQA